MNSVPQGDCVSTLKNKFEETENAELFCGTPEGTQGAEIEKTGVIMTFIHTVLDVLSF